MLRFVTGLLVAVLIAGCSKKSEDSMIEFSSSETRIDYTVSVEGSPDEAITDLLEQSLLLYHRQEDGAQSLAFLRRRGQGDGDIAQKILRSEAYFEAQVDIKVTEAADGGLANAHIKINPGRRFQLSIHQFNLTAFEPGARPDLPGPSELGSPVGRPATAAAILAAEGAAVAELRHTGYPYATLDGRGSVADMEAATIEVETRITTGRYFTFGDITFEGADGVEETYLRTYLPWAPGEPLDTRMLATFQRALIGTNLFDAGSVRLPETPPETEALPIAITLEEGPPRTISLGLRYSTDAGPAARAGFEHRNLFGANEKLNTELLIGLTEQHLETQYRVPQYRRPGQDLVAGLAFRNIEDDAFNEQGVTFTLGLERKLGNDWLVGAGGLLEASKIDDEGIQSTTYLTGLPLFAALDRTDDLLDPTEGVRLRFEVTPFAGFSEQGTPIFLHTDAIASAYYDLTGEKAYILAGRARLGAILANDIDDVPAPRRHYSGGGGSVRGYQDRIIGPLDANDDPVGGLSVLELGAELRARVSGNIGMAVFVEAGSVSEDIAPTFSDGLQMAAGLGARYYSPVGPIRLDVGFPLNPRDPDNVLEFYISIGQAF